jgi:hypothetical protein
MACQSPPVWRKTHLKTGNFESGFTEWLSKLTFSGSIVLHVGIVAEDSAKSTIAAANYVIPIQDFRAAARDWQIVTPDRLAPADSLQLEIILQTGMVRFRLENTSGVTFTRIAVTYLVFASDEVVFTKLKGRQDSTTTAIYGPSVPPGGFPAGGSDGALYVWTPSGGLWLPVPGDSATVDYVLGIVDGRPAWRLATDTVIETGLYPAEDLFPATDLYPEEA